MPAKKQHSNTSEGIRLAEASDWAGLQRLIEKAPEYAQECDDYGMLPIHWASTENNVPLCLLLLLLQAYPEGACIKNNASLLPLHIAIRARASAKWLSELLRVYPESIDALTPNGQSILELAIQSSVSAEAIKVLQQARMKIAAQPEQDYEQDQKHQQHHLQQQQQKELAEHAAGKLSIASSTGSFVQQPINHLVSPVSMCTSSNTLNSFETSNRPRFIPAPSLQQQKQPNNQIDHGTAADVPNPRYLGQRKFSLDHHAQAALAENKSRFIQKSGGRATPMLGGRHQSLPLLPSFEQLRLQEQQRIRQQQQQQMQFEHYDEDEDESSEEDDDILQSRRRGGRNGAGAICIDGMPFESPPEWKLDDECSICHASFGMFKHRHHCRNCGKSICSQHSADKKIIMTNKGFTTPQRVCVTCYAMITHSRSKSNQRQHYEDDLDLEDNENYSGEDVYDRSERARVALKSTQAFRHMAAMNRSNSFTTNQQHKSSIHNLHAAAAAAAAATSAAIHSSSPGTMGTGSISGNGLTSLSQDKAETYLLQAQVTDLLQVVSSLQKQVETLTQSKMNMQQQILEQEELKAETMLLITQLMTRVSVLELQKSHQEEGEEEHQQDFDQEGVEEEDFKL